jgi:hypothetical protein
MEKINLVTNNKGALKIINNLDALINNENYPNETVFFLLSSKLKENTLKNNVLLHDLKCDNIIVKDIQDFAEDLLTLNINFTPILIYVNKTKNTYSILPVFYTFKGIKL